MNSFAFTCGDINGIGPEIVIKTLNKITAKRPGYRFYFICPAKVFLNNSLTTRPSFEFEIVNKIPSKPIKQVLIVSRKNYPHSTGKATVSSGKAAFNSLQTAFELYQRKMIDAVITAPVSKKAINLAGHNFVGQTEIFAGWTGAKQYAMMFLSQKLNAALVTIHSPLRKIPNLIKTNRLTATINLIYNTLKLDLGYEAPQIAVLGLNPHAGEEGLIGDEEIRIILPAIRNLSSKINLEGPFSPDAFWGNKKYKNFDCVIGMYHDQVLIPFKILNFGRGVNFTAGLPIVRTSPDHGTAFDIAGKGIADESSMVQAFNYALKIVKNRKKHLEQKKS